MCTPHSYLKWKEKGCVSGGIVREGNVIFIICESQWTPKYGGGKHAGPRSGWSASCNLMSLD